MTLTDFVQMVINAANVLRTFVIALFCYVIGWWLLTSAGWRMVKWGNPRRQYGAASIVTRSIVGTLFIQSASWLNMVTLTITGYEMPDNNAMSVMPTDNGNVTSLVFSAVLAWAGLLGVVAILRGTQLLVKAADGAGQSHATTQDPVFTGCVFIVSGAIGVNLWRLTSGLF